MRREECMDLLDFIPEGGWAALLKKTHEQLSAIYQSRQQQLPMQNTNRQATPHPLDRLVIDYLINDILTKNGIKISAVRAGFEEGNEIFVGSALYDKTHIQVAIRDSNVIQNSILLRAADF